MSKLSKRDLSTSAPPEVRPFKGLTRIQPHTAGADIGAHEIVICIPGPGATQIVRTFGNYTEDLHAIANWLIENGIETVAMESTGVYWIPLFETLETRGLHCCLISGAATRRIPGRHKSDVLDCQWIQTLHSYGLLSESFRPDADLIALRTLLRHRAQLIEHRSPHILHMQKALLYMNIQLSQALSDITGATGMAIIRAIVAGERDPPFGQAGRLPQLPLPKGRRRDRQSPHWHPSASLRAGMAGGAPLRPQAIPGNVRLLHQADRSLRCRD